MKTKMQWQYFLPGFFMGLSLPVLSLLSIMFATHETFSLQTLINIHRVNPFIWLLDCAPFASAYIMAQNIQRNKQLSGLAERLQVEALEKDQRAKNEESFFEALIENSPFAITQLDANQSIVAFNPAFEALFGYTGAEIIGRHLDEFVVSKEHYDEAAEITRKITSGEFVKLSGKRRKKDGTYFDAEIIGIPVFAGGEKIGALGIYNDISAQKQTEQELQLSERRFKSLFYDSPISLWEEDFSAVKVLLEQMTGQGEDVIDRLKHDLSLVRKCISLVKILDVNQATLDLFEADSKDELQNGLTDVLPDESLDAFRRELIALYSGELVFECEIAQNKRNSDVPIYGLLRLSVTPGSEDTWAKVIISIVDITARRQAEQELRYISFHDTLTGLYNRAYFEEEMKRLEKSRQYPVTIIAVDLDNLKIINDTLGHDAGDRVLQGAAAILINSFRNEDVIARVGGDEFAVILPNVDQQISEGICHRVVAEIERFNQEGAGQENFFPISLSHGKTVVPMGESLFEGYKRADELMYANKEQKRRKLAD